MEQLLSIIIFTIPGLLVYFWIQAFGLNPVVKHSPTELAAVTSLFWIPTVLLVVISYDLLYLFFDFIFRSMQWDISSLELNLISNLREIQTSSTNIIFLVIFFSLSLGFSFLVAQFWVFWYDKYLLQFINKFRLKRKLTKLSDTTAVWDAFFHKLKTQTEEGLVVEVFKLEKPNIKIVGSVTKMSRPYEMERALVLDHVEEWTESTRTKDYKKESSYVDIKSGLIVTALNPNDYKSISLSAEALAQAEQPGDPQNAADE